MITYVIMTYHENKAGQKLFFVILYNNKSIM